MPSRSKKTMACAYTARPGTVYSLHTALNLGGRTHFAVVCAVELKLVGNASASASTETGQGR